MKKDVNHRDVRKERYWRDIVKRQGRSGGTVRDFCHREGIQESAFYWWRRELSRRGVKHAASGRHFKGVKRAVNEPAHKAARFLPVKVADANEKATGNNKNVAGDNKADGGLELRLRAGCMLYVKPGFDRQTLLDVLAALESGSC